MKQKLIILITLLSFSLYANAQEYRLAKSSGQLKLNITGVIVEGYDGKDIIFSGQKVVNEEPSDERAKGLIAISSSKYTDNTGLGISVTESGQDVSVNMVAKKPIPVLTIKVPNNIKVSIFSNSYGLFFDYGTSSGYNNYNGKVSDEIVIKNLKSEIEVSVYSNKIMLENNTGPMNIKTVSGPVDAIFNSDIKGPVSIISATNYVDVTMPSSTKANIEMSSSYGKLYAGKEFKIDFDEKDPEKYALNVLTNETRIANRPISPTKRTNEEVVVRGYPTGTLNITKENTNIKDTANIQRAKVRGVQINGTGSNGVQIYRTTGFLWGGGGDKIKGKLNGGGIDLIFKSTNKNVYLRQQ